MDEKKTEIIRIYTTPSVKKSFQELMEELGATESTYGEKLIKAALKKRF